METRIYWIPIYCMKVLANELGRSGVGAFLVQVRPLLQRLAERRRRSHQQWSRLHLSRREQLAVWPALESGEAELRDMALCLDHLESFVRTGRRAEAGRALARWERAERQHSLYRQSRLAIEPWLADRLARCA